MRHGHYVLNKRTYPIGKTVFCVIEEDDKIDIQSGTVQASDLKVCTVLLKDSKNVIDFNPSRVAPNYIGACKIRLYFASNQEE